MMGIYIKGMEMPKEGTVIAIYKLNGQFYASLRGTGLCPLVLVPEHGDLIDRDEMFEEFVIEGQKSTRYKIGERWELNGEEIRRVIANLPAVITAEESK